MKRQLKKSLKIFNQHLNIATRTSRAKKAGQDPGELVYTGILKDTEIEISLIKYDADTFEKKSSSNLDTILSEFDDNKINWLNIDALFDTGIIQNIGEHFKLHSLILEDILNTQQQAKTEIEDDYAFITMKMLTVNKESGNIEHEHVSFVLGKHYVISLQERKTAVFDTIRERLENEKWRARKRTADFLLYLLIDAVVDNYYFVMDNLNDKIDDLEEKVYLEPTTDNFEKIIEFKKQLIYLKKAISPLEAALRELTDDEFEFIDSKHHKYYSDVYDHLKSIIQDVEILREILLGHIELYMSALSVKMNNVMKTLTIVASIFIPLTFVAGVYGMNFKYMPELDWVWGYPLSLFLMAGIGITMFLFMKRKHWF